MGHCVGTIDQIPKGSALVVEIKGVSIGIFYENAQLFAVRNVCPHKQAPICSGTVCGTMLPSDPSIFEFGLEGQVLKCPWHGWEFSLKSGESLFGISKRKIKTYPVEERDGRIYVKMGER